MTGTVALRIFIDDVTEDKVELVLDQGLGNARSPFKIESRSTNDGITLKVKMSKSLAQDIVAGLKLLHMEREKAAVLEESDA